MDIDQITLARKYATAFLNLFSDEINIKDFCAIVSVEHFLKSEPEITSFFKFPRMNKEKQEIVDHILKEFQCAPVLKKLMQILFEHQRLFLLPLVLKYVQRLYKERRGIMEFEIQSSHALTQDQMATIKNFLSAKTGNHILYEYKENRDLIAGIRLKSDTLLWERSVARKLADVQQLLEL